MHVDCWQQQIAVVGALLTSQACAKERRYWPGVMPVP
jgi:hypothetical protein